MPRKRSRPTPALFYGFPVEVIASWCQVTKGTAYLYKVGQRKPSRQAIRLFVIHRDRRLLTEEWKGWVIKPDSIVDPKNNKTPRNLLRGYSLILQYVNAVVERYEGEQGKEDLRRILNLAAKYVS